MVSGAIEDSRQRLGFDSIEIAFVHDLSPDLAFFPILWEEQYEIARNGAFPSLSQMRDDGINGWGVGVNMPMAILKVVKDADPDVCLCARQCSLVDHGETIENFLPKVREKGVGLVIGASLNAGFIASSPRYHLQL